MNEVIPILEPTLAESTALVLGDPHQFSPAALARIAVDAALDKQIAALARAGVTYPQMAQILEMSLPDLLRRIGSLISTRDDIMSSSMLNDHLLFELSVLNEVIANASSDMNMQATDEISESVASKARHNGRLAVIKALQQHALVMGLVRARTDIRIMQKVAISVVSEDQWNAL